MFEGTTKQFVKTFEFSEENQISGVYEKCLGYDSEKNLEDIIGVTVQLYDRNNGLQFKLFVSYDNFDSKFSSLVTNMNVFQVVI